MQTSGELHALLNLIEDPDDEIYQMVTSRLLDLGDEVIPLLEEHKQSVSDTEQLQKLDRIISKISISTLENALMQWKQNGELSILDAVLTISMYINRETDKHQFFFEVEKIRKNVWLEINDYLTPLEEVVIMNRIIFDYYKFKGVNTDYRKMEEFDLMYLFSSKKANSYSIAALYLIITELLGISLKPITIPQQNLLCYLMEEDIFAPEAPQEIVFYLDPLNGQVYTHKDLENYLKKIDYSAYSIKLDTNTSAAFIKKWLLALAKCEKENGFLFKEKELIRIARMMEGE
jgi:regulator of sirC expression with transglutaminase-like and TPR domain